MKLIFERLSSLKALYSNQLRYLLSAEEQVAIGLERMFDTARDAELKHTLQSDWHEAEAQADRLSEMLRRVIGKAEPLKCKAVHALLEESEDMIKDAAHETIRDAVLIAAAQRIKHYEIAVYGTLKRFAENLGFRGDAEMLEKNLQEEKRADQLLTGIAERIDTLARQLA